MNLAGIRSPPDSFQGGDWLLVWFADDLPAEAELPEALALRPQQAWAQPVQRWRYQLFHAAEWETVLLPCSCS